VKIKEVPNKITIFAPLPPKYFHI